MNLNSQNWVKICSSQSKIFYLSKTSFVCFRLPFQINVQEVGVIFVLRILCSLLWAFNNFDVVGKGSLAQQRGSALRHG